MRKSQLLLIGEFSKITGASVKSLRYYERLGLLTPAYIDPDTSYRYYELEQSFIVEIIQICIELDIELKSLTQYIHGELIDFAALLQFGKEIAERKLEALERSLRYIVDAQSRIEQIDRYANMDFYKRQIQRKYFHVEPVKSFEADDLVAFFKSAYAAYDISDSQTDSFVEYGLMMEVTPTERRKYVFMEVLEKSEEADLKEIPEGEYLCKITKASQIEEWETLFENKLPESSSFLIIETEHFASKYKMDTPLHEIRVINRIPLA